MLNDINYNYFKVELAYSLIQEQYKVQTIFYGQEKSFVTRFSSEPT
jgi:hypothetical protein